MKGICGNFDANANSCLYFTRKLMVALFLEEILTCIAHWNDDRDPSQSFLIGTLDYLYRRTLEDRLRCFLLKKAGENENIC